MPVIKAADLAYGRLRSPDLDKQEEFLTAFGMVRADRTRNALYMRGTDAPHHIHVTELGEPKYVGIAFHAASLEDLEKLSRAAGASAIEDIDEPGGGKRVRLTDPDGFQVEIVHGMAVSTSARIYSCVLADQIIFSDGVNTPFMWSGAAFTVLANCPVLYGQPRIHYAKLFGIKAVKRNTIVWSEENDPTIGYEAGIYNNGWELVQTRAEGLHALFATNEALYYFRERTIGAIRGEVTPDFRSDGMGLSTPA